MAIFGNDLGDLQRNVLADRSLRDAEFNNAANRFTQVSQFQQGLRERAKQFDWQNQQAARDLALKEQQLAQQREAMANAYNQNMQHFSFLNKELEARKQMEADRLAAREKEIADSVANSDYWKMDESDRAWAGLAARESQPTSTELRSQEFKYKNLNDQANQGLFNSLEEIQKAAPWIPMEEAQTLWRQNQAVRSDVGAKFNWDMDVSGLLNRYNEAKAIVADQTPRYGQYKMLPWTWGGTRDEEKLKAAQAVVAELEPRVRELKEKQLPQLNQRVIYAPTTPGGTNWLTRPVYTPPWMQGQGNVSAVPVTTTNAPFKYVSSAAALGAEPSNTVSGTNVPDVQGILKEARYAIDVLKKDPRAVKARLLQMGITAEP